MRKIDKNINIAVIFMLIAVFLCPNISYPFSSSSLRPPSHFSKSTEKYIETNYSGSPAYVQPKIVPKPWGRRLFSDENIGQLAWEIEDKETGVTFMTFGDWVATQFHDSKDELLIVLGVDQEIAGGSPKMIVGFSAQSKAKHGDLVKNEYQAALKGYTQKLIGLIEILKNAGFELEMKQEGHVMTVAKKAKDNDPTGRIQKALSELESARSDVDFFYAYMEVAVGDVVIIPRNCLHACGPGIDVLEFTLPGKSISLDDMDKYPVRYTPIGAPEWIKAQAKGFLEWDRITDIDAGVLIDKRKPKVISEEGGVKVEDLAELVEPKIAGLNRITMDRNTEMKVEKTSGPHLFLVLQGSAEVVINGERYAIPKVDSYETALLIPKEIERYAISANAEGAQIIDLFVLVPADIRDSRRELAQGVKEWINSGLGRSSDAPLDWEDVELFNKTFIANRDKQNTWVSVLWDILYNQLTQVKPRVLQEELSKNSLSAQRPLNAPPVLAIAVPNTVVFAAHLKETKDGLHVVSSDAMSAGKIFSAAQALVGFGQRVKLISFVGRGSVGKQFKKFAGQIGFDAFLPIETNGDTRFAPNIVRDEDAFEWHFSAPGPSFTSAEVSALYDAAEDIYNTTDPGTIVIMGGKVPLGSDITFWTKLIQQAKSHGMKVFFDNLDSSRSSEELQKILSAGVYLIKPNLGEFANLVGKDRETFLNSPESIVREAHELISSVRKNGGVLEVVVVSLAEKGAILVTPEEAYFALNPKITPKNSLGAGDAMVGALAHKISLNRPMNETIKFAVATATISTQKPGVVRTATLSEAESLSSKIWATSVELGKDNETWYADEIPSNVFEFENGALGVALQCFSPQADIPQLKEVLLNFKGINNVSWDDDTLTIISETEVVKLHPKQHEINEQLGLKDRFYVRQKPPYADDIAVKIYYKDGRDNRKKSDHVYVLGVGRNSHDSGAVLLEDGVVIGAIEEERLVQDKHTRAYFPIEATRYLLKAHGLTWKDISHIAVTYDYNFFRDTPHSKNPYHHFRKKFGIEGLESEAKGRYGTERLQAFLQGIGIRYGNGYVPPVTFVKHHKAHAASAWYSSGFPEPTLIVVNDGRGEDEATSIWLADQGKIKKISSTPYIHSLGHFYHIVTKYLGYRSHDEGKVMGFAPYGAPKDKQEETRVEKLRSLMQELVQFDTQTGQVKMAQEYFNFRTIQDFTEVNFSKEFLDIIGEVVRPFPESMGRTLDPFKPEHRPYANLAYVLQERVEQMIMQMLKFYLQEHAETKGIKHVVMAGGLSLNIAANGKIIESGIVDADKLFVPAFPADDGAPVGAGLSVANEEYRLDTRNVIEKISLGRQYSDEEIKAALDRHGLREGEDYIRVENDEGLIKEVTDALTGNQTVAWFQGGAELGPRALGNRSILHRLDDAEGNLIVNRIKNREPWRPSALSIQEEHADEFLKGINTAPFMTIGFPVVGDKKDIIKAGVHPADGITRPQTVSREANPLYWELLEEMGIRTGVPGVLNTSFNRWGPIVETPKDALNTLYYTEGIDKLAIGHFIVKRTKRLKPSMLSARDEPVLKERFNKVRYDASATLEEWNLFWETANDLVKSRNAKHQDFLIVYAASTNGDQEILRIPLIKEMFQRGPCEKIISDLAKQIQKHLKVGQKTAITIRTTALEYEDIAIGLFEQFSSSEIKANWHIVKSGYGREFATSAVSLKDSDSEYPNPLVSLRDPMVFEFVRDILYSRYAQYGLEIGLVDRILQYSLDNCFDPERACAQIYKDIIDFPSREKDDLFHRIYFGIYKEEVKPNLLRDSIEGKIKGPVVLDAGAGMTALASSLLKDNEEIRRFISTHNIDYRYVKIEDSRMEFVLETTEGGLHIDLEDNSVDTIIVTGRLHHLYPGKELDLFKEFMRILHPEGKILIVEDAWSEDLPDPSDDEFAKRFRNLSREKKQEVMAFLDWVGTRLLPGSEPMPRPWNFKSIEDWDEQLFKLSGFTVISKVYHGFPGSKFTPLPLSVVELRKTEKASLDLLDRLTKPRGANTNL